MHDSFALFFQDFNECTFWIRHSTGRLCVDPSPSEIYAILDEDSAEIEVPETIVSMSAPDMEAMVIRSLTLEGYHNICWLNLSELHRFTTVSLSTIVNIGAVISNQHKGHIEIASCLDATARVHRWGFKGGAGGITAEGWTRLKSGDVLNSTIQITGSDQKGAMALTWLCQSNHIFSRLRITSNLEAYVLVEEVDFELKISATTEDSPEGFLFLCPVTDFRMAQSLFRWPDCPAYWSLDPMGAERLSTEAHQK
ncbi:hypothetical protein MVEN_02537000 [Mycena venus]|uniref:Uncharacterized protein n=1 Tax=Mycena venus TaxID=2733690 RepID=A0A8H6U2N4_9AGAR|nr:hypothetical protein MVEN_02537000 [Mycena venus]